jgi:hypothetical protein
LAPNFDRPRGIPSKMAPTSSALVPSAMKKRLPAVLSKVIFLVVPISCSHIFLTWFK